VTQRAGRGRPCAAALEGAARARPAPRRGEVAVVERRDQLADLGALDLVVGGQRHDELARGVLEAGHQRRGFAELPGQADDGDAVSVVDELAQAGGEASGCGRRARR
jgi:hypothetical protein